MLASRGSDPSRWKVGDSGDNGVVVKWCVLTGEPDDDDEDDKGR